MTSDFGAAKFGLPWSPADNNLGFFEVAFWFSNDVAQYGGIFKMFPVLFAWMGAFSEAVGSIFLIVGLQTRVFSFLILCTMMVAAFLQQWGNGTWNMLPALGFAWVSLFTVILGSGRFGRDYLISKKLSMKKYQLILLSLLIVSASSCMQKAYKKKVVITLTVQNIKDIKTMAIRGNGKPLSPVSF